MEETLVYREIEGMEDESCSFVEDAKAQIISTEAELEAKHIWGDDADLFCSYHCTGFLGNLLASLGSREVKDTDFFQTIINYFTTEEINDLYYKILPPFDELARAELEPHEKRPDLRRLTANRNFAMIYDDPIANITKAGMFPHDKSPNVLYWDLSAIHKKPNPNFASVPPPLQWGWDDLFKGDYYDYQ